MREAEQRAKLNEMDTTGGMNKYGPVDARVFVHSPNIWYQRIEINKGINDGVHRGDPVINGAGLVGKVEDVTGGSAVVTLITDQSFATGVYRGRGAASAAASRPPSARPATCCSSPSTPTRRSRRATSSTPRARPTAACARATRRRS